MDLNGHEGREKGREEGGGGGGGEELSEHKRRHDITEYYLYTCLSYSAGM